MHKKEKSADIIRSLSGLVNYRDLIVGVSDEFHGLFVRGPKSDSFHNFSAFPEHLEYREQKKLKPDYESLSVVTVENRDYLIAFPSLSKKNRDLVGIFQISAVADQLVIHSQKVFRASKLLNLLSETSTELNIEGHIFYQNQLLLLNRGNEKSKNEFIVINSGTDWCANAITQNVDESFNYTFTRQFVDLGMHDGHPIHWTEGIWERDSILFLATVEKTDNAYDDGEVLASFVGRYDFKSGQVLGVKKILDAKKAEGICRWRSRYLIAIDSDSADMSNEFYSIALDVLD